MEIIARISSENLIDLYQGCTEVQPIVLRKPQDAFVSFERSEIDKGKRIILLTKPQQISAK